MPVIYRLDKDGYYRGPSDGFGYVATNGLLHRIVWMENHGPIPEGFDVHHIDGDRENNVIENLELLPRGEHMAHHRYEGRARDVVCVECGVTFVARAMKEVKFCCTGHRDRYNKRAARRRRH
jgi:hypothetical protein